MDDLLNLFTVNFMGLFSIHTHTKETTAVPYEKSVNIHEHRAPTDESINTLNEMEEKARLNVVRKFFLQDNIVNGAVIEFEDKRAHVRILTFRFTVNGQEVLFDIKRSDYEQAMSKTEVMETLLQEAAKQMILQVAQRHLAQNVFNPRR